MKGDDNNNRELLSEITQDLLNLAAPKAKGTKVEEPGVGYISFFANKMAIIQVIQSGLPFSLFEKIRSVSPFTESEWAEFLGVSSKTLQRQKKESNFKFKPIQSEKILELAEVVNLGLSVFDTSNQFYGWLKEPSFALGKMKPIDLIRDSYGKELVMDELNRIEFGVFA
ncbi:type II RES/Xre toxin-antitoxin system antitoxin [Halocola ammonii]